MDTPQPHRFPVRIGKEMTISTLNRCGLATTSFVDKLLIDNLLQAHEGVEKHKFAVSSDIMLPIRLQKDVVIETFTKALQNSKMNVIAYDQKTLVVSDAEVHAVFTFQQRSKYSTLYGEYWCETHEVKRDFSEWVKNVFKGKFIFGDLCGLRWAYRSKNGLSTNYLEELLTDDVLDEAYPSIIQVYGSLNTFATEYLESEESVLLLQGPPGTGKSRLIRYLMRKLVQAKKGLAIEDEYYDDRQSRSLVLYTSDTDSLKSDELFAMFMTSDEIMFVIEDADNMLRSRSKGNDDVHRFLTVSDGIIRNVGRKVIFTTNLANMNDVDDALVRPGRCFAALGLGGLKKEEALIFAEKLSKGDKHVVDYVFKFFDNHKMMTLAEIYRVYNGTKLKK